MKIAALIACSLASAGCYKHGADESCTVRCNNQAPCSNGLTCEVGLCRDLAQPACTSDAGPIDALFDADPDAYLDAPADASTMLDAPYPDAPPGCYGTDLFTNCPTPPTLDWTLTMAELVDTDSSTRCVSTVSPVCLIVNRQITITDSLVARGNRPLVLIGTVGITVTAGGTIEVSSDSERGAGAHAGNCGAPTAGGTTAVSGGGGAGGTLSGRGGFGGSSGGTTGGTPSAVLTTPLTAVRGGCPGTAGGGINRGGPGFGGGGVVLITAGQLDIAGAVLARGAGGRLGGLGGGGGGGGSGGLIALDAPSITITGALIAAGGGGGGGGGSMDAGGTGEQASAIGDPGSGGAGGLTPPGGGAGGSGSGPTVLRNGFSGAMVPQQGAGGGGGGGAAGIIRLRGPLNSTGGTIVPPAT